MGSEAGWRGRVCEPTREPQEPLATCGRAQRREQKEQPLTRGDPPAERRWEVRRGRSSAGGTHEQTGVPMRRAEGPNRANRGAGTGDERTNAAVGRDNCGRHPGLTNDRPKAEGPQPVGVFGVTSLRAWEGRTLDGPTAGCGKPHVRWCGRVPGRNPRHPTRSRSDCGDRDKSQTFERDSDAKARSAGFQPAVAPNFIRQTVRGRSDPQIENLRYSRLKTCATGFRDTTVQRGS